MYATLMAPSVMELPIAKAGQDRDKVITIARKRDIAFFIVRPPF